MPLNFLPVFSLGGQQAETDYWPTGRSKVHGRHIVTWPRPRLAAAFIQQPFDDVAATEPRRQVQRRVARGVANIDDNPALQHEEPDAFQVALRCRIVERTGSALGSYQIGLRLPSYLIQPLEAGELASPRRVVRCAGAKIVCHRQGK